MDPHILFCQFICALTQHIQSDGSFSVIVRGGIGCEVIIYDMSESFHFAVSWMSKALLCTVFTVFISRFPIKLLSNAIQYLLRHLSARFRFKRLWNSVTNGRFRSSMRYIGWNFVWLCTCTQKGLKIVRVMYSMFNCAGCRETTRTISD